MLYNITTNIHPSVHFLSTDHHAQVFISLWNLWGFFFIPSANKNRFAIPQKQTWFKFVQSLCCGNCSNNCRFPWFMGESEMPFHGYYRLYSSNNLSPHMQSFALKLQAPAEEMHVFVISFPTLPFITCCKLGETSSEIIGFK